MRYQPAEGVTPRLQRVLDALDPSPAMVRTSTWDVVAWNRGAAAVLNDYKALPPDKRNILRMIFLDQRVRQAQYDWESVARFVVGAFRADAARAGATAQVAAMVEELRAQSPEFDAFWNENDVRTYGEGVKRLRHPVVGEDRPGVFILRRRRPARPDHGGLQSGHAGGPGQGQRAGGVAAALGFGGPGGEGVAVVLLADVFHDPRVRSAALVGLGHHPGMDEGLGVDHRDLVLQHVRPRRP